MMLDFKESCIEWLKGCSNTMDGHPEDCKQCTTAFREHIEKLLAAEAAKPKTYGIWSIYDSRWATSHDGSIFKTTDILKAEKITRMFNVYSRRAEVREVSQCEGRRFE